MAKAHYRRAADGQTYLLKDGLTSATTRLGTSDAKAATAVYVEEYLDPAQLVAAFRNSWVTKKAVVIPAQDATRKWRIWSGKQAKEIEDAEKVSRIRLRKKVFEAQWKARLFGGAAILIGLRDGQLDQPLVVDDVQQGDLEYLSVLTPHKLTSVEIEDDPRQEFYNRPKQYRLSTNTGETVYVHPTRAALFYGAPRPEVSAVNSIGDGWDDSVLQGIYDACRNLDATMGNIAELIYDAKTDVISIPDLMERISDPRYEADLIKRFALARQTKGNMGTLLLDKDEEYQTTTYAFSGLDGVADRFMQIASGATDIPMTRFLGMSPGGLNSTGEGDLTNYYDGIGSMQVNDLQPAITLLDQALVRSTLGDWPDDLEFEWAPLRQMTEKEVSELRSRDAETVSKLSASQVYPDEAVAEVGAHMFQQSGVDALSEAESRDEGDDLDGEGLVLGDAAPRTLYVHRKVKNAAAIIAWAKEQGFSTTLPADDLHVTIAFSRNPVDWMKAGSDWESEVKVPEGGPRLMERFGDATVLLFASSSLSWRHEHMKRAAGATWDHPDYQPHITISYDKDAPELADIEPFKGEIILGPEVFEEVNEKWLEKVTEE